MVDEAPKPRINKIEVGDPSVLSAEEKKANEERRRYNKAIAEAHGLPPEDAHSTEIRKARKDN